MSKYIAYSKFYIAKNNRFDKLKCIFATMYMYYIILCTWNINILNFKILKGTQF